MGVMQDLHAIPVQLAFIPEKRKCRANFIAITLEFPLLCLPGTAAIISCLNALGRIGVEF